MLCVLIILFLLTVEFTIATLGQFLSHILHHRPGQAQQQGAGQVGQQSIVDPGQVTFTTTTEREPVRGNNQREVPGIIFTTQSGPALHHKTTQQPGQSSFVFSSSTTLPRSPKQQQTLITGNHTWRGKTFLLTWREGRMSFTWEEAKRYCSQKGMMMVSLDDPAKREHLLQVVADDEAPYFWAGGKVSLDKAVLWWENGMVEKIVGGEHPWSHTGSRGEQPDGQNTEHCLAVLNNFYNVSNNRTTRYTWAPTNCSRIQEQIRDH